MPLPQSHEMSETAGSRFRNTPGPNSEPRMDPRSEEEDPDPKRQGHALGQNDIESSAGNSIPLPVSQSSSKQLPLDYRPTLLETWVLVLSIVLNLAWVGFLTSTWWKPSFHGNEFVFGGSGAGLVASILKFLVTQQVLGVGLVLPYRSMHAASEIKSVPGKGNYKNTIGADYCPYEWPITRIRSFLNKDYFFYAIDLATFISSLTIVQFESNILRPTSRGSYEVNRGAVVIAIVCHCVFILITIIILVWLEQNLTGLLAAPGSIAMYLAMLRMSDVREDYQGIEAESQRWIVRSRLGENVYQIGYYSVDDEDGKVVYEIRRRNQTSNKAQGESLQPVDSAESSSDPCNVGTGTTRLPRFDFIPWFVRPRNMVVSTALLAVAISVAATLVADGHTINYGFAPHAPVEALAWVSISPAAFLWSFMPSLIADQYRLLVKSIDTFYRIVQPYADLKQEECRAQKLVRCFTINYTNDLPIIITVKSLCNRHWKVAAASCFSLCSSVIPAFAANMFYLDFDGDQNQRIYIWERYFWIVIAYMGILIIFLPLYIPDQTRYMPHDLETISDHISLLSQSSLLEDDGFKVRFDAVAEEVADVADTWPKRLRTKMRALGSPNHWKLEMAAVWLAIKLAAEQTNPWYLPKPVKAVEDRLHKHYGAVEDNPMLPRFAIWRNDELPEFTCSIDVYQREGAQTSKAISLYETSYFKFNIWRRAKEFLL